MYLTHSCWTLFNTITLKCWWIPGQLVCNYKNKVSASSHCIYCFLQCRKTKLKVKNFHTAPRFGTCFESSFKCTVVFAEQTKQSSSVSDALFFWFSLVVKWLKCDNYENIFYSAERQFQWDEDYQSEIPVTLTLELESSCTHCYFLFSAKYVTFSQHPPSAMRSVLPVCKWNMGQGGLCYLNQRAVDSQLTEPDGIWKSAASLSRGTVRGWEKAESRKTT